MKISAYSKMLLLICVATGAWAFDNKEELDEELGESQLVNIGNNLQGSHVTGNSRWLKLLHNEPKQINKRDTNGTAKIINGQAAKPGEFPHQVRLEVDLGDEITFCGAVIIGVEVILTAAHCVVLSCDSHGNPTYVNDRDVRAIAGDHSRLAEDGEVEIGIGEIYTHNDFNCKSLDNDIAMLVTDTAMEFKISETGYGSVGEIYLSNEPDKKYPAGEQAILTGWGLTEPFGELSDILQVAQLELVDDFECQQAWAGRGIDTDRQICAFARDGIVGSCRGDSGGPLVRLMDDGRYELVGLVSFGLQNCSINSGAPTIHTRVSHYLDWMNTRERSLFSSAYANSVPNLKEQ